MRTVVLCKCVSLVYDFKNREYSKDLRTPRYFSQNSHKVLFIFTEVPLYHQLHASHIGLQFFENMIQCFYKLVISVPKSNHSPDLFSISKEEGKQIYYPLG